MAATRSDGGWASAGTGTARSSPRTVGSSGHSSGTTARPFTGLAKQHGDSVKILHESQLGELDKEPYAETRPLVPCFTRHVEFFKDSRGRVMKTEAATWQLGLRSQTPAFTAPKLSPPSAMASGSAPNSARAKSAPATDLGMTPRWQANFTGLREHTFDMLRDVYSKKAPEADGKPSPSRTPRTPRTPRIHVDPYRATGHLDEPYRGKVGANMEAYRTHLQARVHPDVCRHFLTLR